MFYAVDIGDMVLDLIVLCELWVVVYTSSLLHGYLAFLGFLGVRLDVQVCLYTLFCSTILRGESQVSLVGFVKNTFIMPSYR